MTGSDHLVFLTTMGGNLSWSVEVNMPSPKLLLVGSLITARKKLIKVVEKPWTRIYISDMRCTQ